MKTLKQVQQAVNDINSKHQQNDVLSEQDLMVLLLASLMEEEGHGSSTKE